MAEIPPSTFRAYLHAQGAADRARHGAHAIGLGRRADGGWVVRLYVDPATPSGDVPDHVLFVEHPGGAAVALPVEAVRVPPMELGPGGRSDDAT